MTSLSTMFFGHPRATKPTETGFLLCFFAIVRKIVSKTPQERYVFVKLHQGTPN
jgi:hypothetical protein